MSLALSVLNGSIGPRETEPNFLERCEVICLRFTPMGQEVGFMADFLRSNNPVLQEKAFAGQIASGETMTVQGTVNKTGLLLLCVVATSAWTWGLAHSPTPEAFIQRVIGGLLGGVETALVTIFKQSWAPITAPLYALLE